MGQQEIERIHTLSDDRIEFYRDLKGEHPRLRARGVILIEGEEQIRRARKCGVSFLEAFLEESTLESDLMTVLEETPRLLVASRELMERIVGYRIHRGLFVLAERPRELELRSSPLPAIAINGVSDPENVGTIARTALAFGFRTILFDRTSSDPLSRRAIRVSMGAVFGLSIVRVEELTELSCLAAKRIALESSGEPLSGACFPDDGRFILILGNEKHGIEKSILANVDLVARIPMETAVLSSLNVAAAAAIACERAYEKLRGKPFLTSRE